jgi:endo-1,4-beta-xylanase
LVLGGERMELGKVIGMQDKRVLGRRGSWALGAFGCVLALTACRANEAVVKEPASASVAPASSGAEASKPGYGQVSAIDMLGGAGIAAFGVRGATERVATSEVAVSGQTFSKALRAEVKQKSQNLWDVQLVASGAGEVKTGDVLLVSFWFRTEYVPAESGEAQVEVNFELNRPPFEKALMYTVQAGAQWKQFFLPFVAKRDFAAGEAQVSFRLGYAPPQTVDIAGIEVENFQKQLALEDLPRTKASYAGMEPDAPWRARADERIDQLRKGDLSVRVLGDGGKPVPNAAVSARLTKHAFNFGTAIPAEVLLAQDRQPLRDILLENFNTATLENDLKWEALEDWGYPLERGIRGVDWLREAGLRVRGHVLVWPSWRETPARLKLLENDKPALRKAVKDHIREVVTALKGRCDQWDVVNEPFTNRNILDVLGDEVMVEWFELARSLDPKPKLFINDFAILSGGGGTTAHRDHYEKMIQLLVDAKAPFDGIGMQGHFGSSLTSPDDLMVLLDRYARFQKEIAITEFDVVIDDEDLAGKYVRDFYTVLFSHPAVSTLVMWGFSDGNHWKKNAAMYREDLTLKPGGQAYKDLVLGQWRTDVRGSTDERGVFQTRGFKGQYEIVVNANGRTKTLEATLADGSSRIDVKI